MERLSSFLDRKRNFIRFLIVVMVFGIAVTGYYLNSISVYNETSPLLLLAGFGLIFLFFTTLFYISYRMLYVKDVSIEKVFLFSIIVMGIVYAFFFTPFTIPDETVHYGAAYRYSNYFMFNFKQIGEESLLIRQEDWDFFTSTSAKISVENYLQVISKFNIFCQDKTMISVGLSMSTSSPLGYIVQAVGIAIGRIFQLGAVPTFYLGRVFNVVAYSCITYMAIKIIPFGKIMVFVVSLMPMTLHLVGSYSYDMLSIAMALLFIALILNMSYRETIIKNKEIIWLIVIAAVLATCKIVYAPLILLVFMIPAKNFSSKKASRWSKALLIIVSIAVFIILQMSTFEYMSSKDNIISWAEEEGYSLSWLLEHPLGTVRLFFNTFISKFDFYLETMTGKILGWFQIATNNYVYVFTFLLLCLSFVRSEEEPGSIGVINKVCVFIIVMISVGMTLMSMLLYWTPISYGTIEGVQGRYFIPLLPAMFMVIRNMGITVKSNFHKHIAFLMIPVNSIVILEIIARMPRIA